MIFNKNEEEHAEDLQLLLTILETIWMEGWRNASSTRNVEFLGHIDKLIAFKTWSAPSTVQSFLGFGNFHRRLIPPLLEPFYPWQSSWS
jgi:hypothetical protein